MISRVTLALMAAAAPLATEAMHDPVGATMMVNDESVNSMRHLSTIKLAKKKFLKKLFQSTGASSPPPMMDETATMPAEEDSVVEEPSTPVVDSAAVDVPMEDSASGSATPTSEEDVVGGVANTPVATDSATTAVSPTMTGEECLTIVQLAETTPDLSTLFTAVGAAPSVAADLSSLTEEFTIFAPNNAAFNALSQEALNALLDDTPALSFILETHVVDTALFAADLMDGDVLPTLNGGNLTVSIQDGTVYVVAPGDGGTMARVVAPDVEGCNGVVHVIDAVLVPGVGAADSAVDSATTPTAAPATGAVPCSQTCYYEVTASMVWTPERFPTDFPPALDDPMAMMNAHFSPLWTVAHDDSFVLWRNGELSNPGIQQIAETGAGDNFMEEVATCGASCGAGEGFPCMPFSGTCDAVGEVRLRETYPYLSAATMVAPSPDWFAGIDSVPLCVDGQWVESITREVFPYDAGTDSGESFLSTDAPTTPFEPIFRFAEVMPESSNIFYNPAEAATLPLGTITITRTRCDGDAAAAGDGMTATPPTPTTTPAAAPIPTPTPAPVPAAEPVTQPAAPAETANGKTEFALCIQGESETFGPIDGAPGVKRGEGVTITSAGQCSWEEFAGGFDGYPSKGIDDGHEKGMDEAIKEMFPGNFDKQTAFLQSMVDMADPVNLDYPQDKAIADGGERMKNIGKLNAACSSLITIQC